MCLFLGTGRRREDGGKQPPPAGGGSSAQGAGRGAGLRLAPPRVTPCRKRARRESPPPVPVRGRHGVPGLGRPLLLARLPAPG